MEAGEEVEAEWCCKELRGWLAEQEKTHLENRQALEAAGNTGSQKAAVHRAMSGMDAFFFLFFFAVTMLNLLHNTFLFLSIKKKVPPLNYG